MSDEQTPVVGEVSIPEEPAAYQEWRRTGKLPEPEPEQKPEPLQEKQKTPEGEEKPESASESESEENKGEPEQHGKKKGGFQRRIDRLGAENAELKARLAAVESKAGGEKPAGASKPTRPDLNDFDDYNKFKAAEDKYVEDLAAWTFEQKEQARQKAESERQAKEADAKRVEAWSKRIDGARKQHDDFDEAMEDVEHIPVSPAMAQALQESEQGAELAYWLAKHPDEMERISKLSPIGAVREIGKLEAKLTAPVPQQKPAVSKAPKPPATVQGGKTAERSVYDPDITPAEYQRIRREQLQRR